MPVTQKQLNPDTNKWTKIYSFTITKRENKTESKNAIKNWKGNNCFWE
jgi:hypothetical protein